MIIEKTRKIPAREETPKQMESLAELMDMAFKKVHEELDKISSRLAKLEGKPKAPEEPKKVRLRAEKGDDYWHIDSWGQIVDESDSYIGRDNYRYAIGNYHLTRWECQAYFEKTNALALALQRIKDWIMANGYEFIPDWKNHNQEKYFLEFSHKTSEWGIEFYESIQTVGVPLFFSEESHAEECIKECQDDLNILIGLK